MEDRHNRNRAERARHLSHILARVHCSSRQEPEPLSAEAITRLAYEKLKRAIGIALIEQTDEVIACLMANVRKGHAPSLKLMIDLARLATPNEKTEVTEVPFVKMLIDKIDEVRRNGWPTPEPLPDPMRDPLPDSLPDLSLRPSCDPSGEDDGSVNFFAA